MINKDTVGGTISFLEGVTLMEATKKALFTAACDLLQPEKYHKQLSLKGAQQFIESCRFGQTEQGSFIATVICPFINQTAEDTVKKLSVFDPAADLRGSLTRSVTTRMMSALSEIKHHIDRGEEKRILNLEGEKMISLNYITGDEEKVAKARVLLSNEDYTRACEAHQQGRSVKIRGKLVNTGRTKMIEQPSFEIVS